MLFYHKPPQFVKASPKALVSLRTDTISWVQYLVILHGRSRKHPYEIYTIQGIGATQESGYLT